MSNENNQLREAIHDAIAAALGDAYDCTRVWSAWSYGTMGQDDFSLITDDSDRMAEITDAAMSAIAAQPAAAQEAVEDRLLVALERAVFAEAALRELADECENDNAPGWEGRMQACLLHARQVLKHAPAPAAQEAVAYWRVTFRMYPENVDYCETFACGPERPTLDTLGITPRPVEIISAEPFYAAPVAAAPPRVTVRVEGIGTATLHVVDGGIDLPVDTIKGMAAHLSTPAAPGIDHAGAALAHLSNALDDLQYSPDQRPVPLIREAMWHVQQMQAHIDASPKGGSDAPNDFGAMTDLLSRWCRNAAIEPSPNPVAKARREVWVQCLSELQAALLATSPEGGSDARARFEAWARGLGWSDFSVFSEIAAPVAGQYRCEITQSHWVVWQAAMQATSAEVSHG